MRAKPPTKRKGSEGRQAFLANLALVKARLAEGWGVIDVFNANRDKFPFSYQQFAKYVRRFVTEIPAPAAPSAAVVPVTAMATAPAQPDKPTPPGQTGAADAKRAPGPVVAGGDAPKTFKHNPVADRDSLI